jgi:hypothetical protein
MLHKRSVSALVRFQFSKKLRTPVFEIHAIMALKMGGNRIPEWGGVYATGQSYCGQGVKRYTRFNI